MGVFTKSWVRGLGLAGVAGCVVVGAAVPAGRIGFSFSAASAAASAAPGEAEVARGRAYYTTCAGCHGNSGEGFVGMHAPRLAGLPRPYVERQLQLFRQDLRGGAADFYGVAMNGRAKALPDDEAVRSVSAYIATLPRASPAVSAGDIDRGRQLYQGCAACHGADAEGVAASGAPPLRGLDGWYLSTQLKNYKAGVRGREGDGPGQLMRAAAAAIPDETAMRDLSAYLTSLR